MIIDTVGKLRAFALKYREDRVREKVDSVLDYHQNRTKPNMVRIAYSLDLVGEEKIARDLLEICRPKVPCGLYGCPHCGKRFKALAKRETQKKIVAKLGRIPEPDEISFGTINGPRVPSLDPEVVVRAFAEFKKKVRTGLRTTRLSALGFFDISLSGLIHWHGLVLHPGLSRGSLRSSLRKAFPGRRVVKVSEWENGKSIWENLNAIIDYSLVTDRHTKLIKGKPKFGAEMPSRIMKRIVALQYMARRNVQGLRLCLNMRTARIWKNGILFDKSTGELIRIPLMEKLILGNGRKRRTDRKWDRFGSVALWPRRRATEQIRGVRPSATGAPAKEAVAGFGSDEAAYVR